MVPSGARGATMSTLVTRIAGTRWSCVARGKGQGRHIEMTRVYIVYNQLGDVKFVCLDIGRAFHHAGKDPTYYIKEHVLIEGKES